MKRLLSILMLLVFTMAFTLAGVKVPAASAAPDSDGAVITVSLEDIEVEDELEEMEDDMDLDVDRSGPNRGPG